MTTTLTLIRHGETAWNALGRWQGHAPVPLNDAGRQQAARLAGHLAPLANEIAAIYSSDLARAAETAQIIAGTLKLAIPVGLDSRLRETDLGDWQGLTRDEILLWDKPRWLSVINNPALPRPGGESPVQVAERGVAALTEYVERHRGAHLLIVSHAGIIRNILQTLDLINIQITNIDNTSATVIVHDHEGEPPWKLRSFNQVAHLESASPLKKSDE